MTTQYKMFYQHYIVNQVIKKCLVVQLKTINVVIKAHNEALFRANMFNSSITLPYVPSSLPSLEFCNQYFVCISYYPMRVTYPAHLNFFNLIMPTTKNCFLPH